MLDIKTLETWLWDGACSIRGAVDAPKFKDYILPLIFIKRVSDVFEDELKRLSDEFGDEKVAYELAQKDHKLVRFFIPRSSTWPEIRKKTKNIGEELTAPSARLLRKTQNCRASLILLILMPRLAGRGLLTMAKLSQLIEVISRHRVGLKDAEPDILGRAYEYLCGNSLKAKARARASFTRQKK